MQPGRGWRANERAGARQEGRGWGGRRSCLGAANCKLTYASAPRLAAAEAAPAALAALSPQESSRRRVLAMLGSWDRF